MRSFDTGLRYGCEQPTQSLLRMSGKRGHIRRHAGPDPASMNTGLGKPGGDHVHGPRIKSGVTSVRCLRALLFKAHEEASI